MNNMDQELLKTILYGDMLVTVRTLVARIPQTDSSAHAQLAEAALDNCLTLRRKSLEPLTSSFQTTGNPSRAGCTGQVRPPRDCWPSHLWYRQVNIASPSHYETSPPPTLLQRSSPHGSPGVLSHRSSSGPCPPCLRSEDCRLPRLLQSRSRPARNLTCPVVPAPTWRRCSRPGPTTPSLYTPPGTPTSEEEPTRPRRL